MQRNMPPPAKMGDINSRRQEVEEMASSWWSCSWRKTTSSPMLVRTASLPLRHTCRTSRWMVVVLVAVVVMLQVAPCCSLVARCLAEEMTASYCNCTKEKVRSGHQITIKCDFQKKEDVLLTENLYPFRDLKASLKLASVRVANATSVKVTQGFFREWLKIPSMGLDLWNCGTVSLASAPPMYYHFSHPFSTFVGIGLVGCRVPEVPARLLRDRVTASLRIKNSVVGTVRRGMLDNVQKVRYIVLEDSVVEQVEGSVAAEGSFTLSQQDGHRWNGLVLNNVTMRSLGPGAFILTHKARERENTHKVMVKDCQVGQVGSGGITAQGDVDVTIKDNIFGKLDNEAFKINVSRDFKFEGNVVESAGEGSLLGLKCHNFTKLDTNTIYITSEWNVTDLRDSSFTPFPASCGHFQAFKVVNNIVPLTTTVFSDSTWILLAMLLLVLVVAGGVLYRWRENNKQQDHSQNDFHSYNGVASSARYQANQQEVNMVQDGIPNPRYDKTAL